MKGEATIISLFLSYVYIYCPPTKKQKEQGHGTVQTRRSHAQQTRTCTGIPDWLYGTRARSKVKGTSRSQVHLAHATAPANDPARIIILQKKGKSTRSTCGRAQRPASSQPVRGGRCRRLALSQQRTPALRSKPTNK